MHQKHPPAKIAVFIARGGAFEGVSAAWAAKAKRAIMAAIARIHLNISAPRERRKPTRIETPSDTTRPGRAERSIRAARQAEIAVIDFTTRESWLSRPYAPRSASVLSRQVLRLRVDHFGRRAVKRDALVIAEYRLAIGRRHLPAGKHAECVQRGQCNAVLPRRTNTSSLKIAL
jgi:hypothetical protein